jgi:transcriptional regulator with XRE-family HTH domain
MEIPVWTKKLQALYAEKGATYREISNVTGIPKSAVQRYIAGEVTTIPPDRLEKLAQFFEVTPGFLMNWLTVDHTQAYQQLPDDSELDADYDDHTLPRTAEFARLYSALDDDSKALIDGMMRKLKESQ